MPLRLDGRLAGLNSLEVAVPGNAAQGEHDRQVPPADDARRGPIAVRLDRRQPERGGPFLRDVVVPARVQSAGRAQRQRQHDQQPDRNQHELHRIGVADAPHAAQQRVERDHGRRNDDRDRQVDSQYHAERGTNRDEQFGTPEHFAQQRRQTQHGRPMLAEPGGQRIDESNELQPPHLAGEEHPAQDQAQPETNASLPSRGDAGEHSFGRAQQVAAVDPGGGHGDRGHPKGHCTARHQQLGRRPQLETLRRARANGEKDRIQRGNRGDSSPVGLVHSTNSTRRRRKGRGNAAPARPLIRRHTLVR